jgi:hypothetical protein
MYAYVLKFKKGENGEVTIRKERNPNWFNVPITEIGDELFEPKNGPLCREKPIILRNYTGVPPFKTGGPLKDILTTRKRVIDYNKTKNIDSINDDPKVPNGYPIPGVARALSNSVAKRNGLKGADFEDAWVRKVSTSMESLQKGRGTIDPFSIRSMNADIAVQNLKKLLQMNGIIPQTQTIKSLFKAILHLFSKPEVLMPKIEYHSRTRKWITHNDETVTVSKENAIKILCTKSMHKKTTERSKQGSRAFNIVGPVQKTAMFLIEALGEVLLEEFKDSETITVGGILKNKRIDNAMNSYRFLLDPTTIGVDGDDTKFNECIKGRMMLEILIDYIDDFSLENRIMIKSAFKIFSIQRVNMGKIGIPHESGAIEKQMWFHVEHKYLSHEVRNLVTESEWQGFTADARRDSLIDSRLPALPMPDFMGMGMLNKMATFCKNVVMESVNESGNSTHVISSDDYLQRIGGARGLLEEELNQSEMARRMVGFNASIKKTIYNFWDEGTDLNYEFTTRFFDKDPLPVPGQEINSIRAPGIHPIYDYMTTRHSSGRLCGKTNPIVAYVAMVMVDNNKDVMLHLNAREDGKESRTDRLKNLGLYDTTPYHGKRSKTNLLNLVVNPFFATINEPKTLAVVKKLYATPTPMEEQLLQLGGDEKIAQNLMVASHGIYTAPMAGSSTFLKGGNEMVRKYKKEKAISKDCIDALYHLEPHTLSTKRGTNSSIAHTAIGAAITKVTKHITDPIDRAEILGFIDEQATRLGVTLKGNAAARTIDTEKMDVELRMAQYSENTGYKRKITDAESTFDPKEGASVDLMGKRSKFAEEDSTDDEGSDNELRMDDREAEFSRNIELYSLQEDDLGL